MRVMMVGAGAVGSFMGAVLSAHGHEVVLVDRQGDAALETSFANGAQISVSFCEPWANAWVPIKVLKWLARDDSPLLFRPRLELAEGYFLAASRLFDADPAAAAKAQAEVDAVQKRSETEPMFRVSYQAFATLMPAMSAIARSERQARSLRGAYRMVLAAELHNHEHGSYPEDAGALKATLGELPRDWFAKDGAALRYRKIDPRQDRLGRAYLVYSVGVDGMDNAGAEDPKNQYKATAGKNPEGLDLVFNWEVEPEPAAR